MRTSCRSAGSVPRFPQGDEARIAIGAARATARSTCPQQERRADPLSCGCTDAGCDVSATPDRDDTSPVEWWSAPQAVVWISTRSDKAVVEAARDRALGDAIRRRNLRPMSPLLPASVGGSLPIPLEAAAHYLCRAACAGLLKIKGSKGGTEEPVMVPIAAGFLVLDLYEEREGAAGPRLRSKATRRDCRRCARADATGVGAATPTTTCACAPREARRGPQASAAERDH